MNSLYEALEALKQYYLQKVQALIDMQNKLENEDYETSVFDGE